MKYRLTALRQSNNTELMLENVVPAKTSHIYGYGIGVTLSSRSFKWNHSSTASSVRMLAFSDPIVIVQ